MKLISSITILNRLMNYKEFSIEINNLIYSNFNTDEKIQKFDKLKKSIKLQTLHSRHISKTLKYLMKIKVLQF